MFALAVLLAAYLLIAPAIGLWGLRLALSARDDFRAQARDLAALRLQVADLARKLGASPGVVPTGGAEPPEDSYPVDEAVAEAPTDAAAPDAARLENTAPAGPGRAKSQLPQSPRGRAACSGRLGALEESLTSRWLVWLGAVTIALAGTFLVKYSIEQGWLRPAVRVSLGLLLGVLLVAGGEWLRRRPLAHALAAIRPDYVPPALTAAGLFIAFASGYAAYALYGLLSPLLAFGLLAVIGVGAVALALLQGPFIALLGLLGGFLTPVLVQTDTPAAWALFGYLLVLTGGALTLVRLRGWWWLGWAALAGSALWPLMWLAAAWSSGNALPVGLYLLALTGLFLVPRRAEGFVEPVGPPHWFAALSQQDRIAWGAACAAAVLSFALVRVDAYGAVSLVTLGLLCAAFLTIGHRDPALDGFAVVGALLSLAAIGAWHLPEIITQKQALYSIAGRAYGSVPGPIVPPELLPFAATAAILGALFGVAGFVALRSARRPGLWAGVSAASPVFLLVVAYWRITAFEVDLTWGAVSLALSGVALAAATIVERDRSRPGFDTALGVYAAAVVASTSLAATMALEQAWLTVALSLQLPALAWIHGRLEERSLRVIAGIVAAAVLIRLAFNPFILDYALDELPALNWILYGYGIPAIAFFIAARGFRRGRDARLVMLLEAGALVFAALLASLEIRNLVVGPLDSPEHPLLEQSLQSIAWLAIALGLQRLAAPGGPPVALWGSRLLAALAAAHVIFLQIIVSNPLVSGDPVPGPVGFNLLSLAYAAPAVFAFALAREYRQAKSPRLAAAAGLAGLGLIPLYFSFEVRHAFHGADLAVGATGDAELYAYSLVWLFYAAALLTLALKTGSASLRYVSLGFLLATAAKVFLIDMASLTGLYRVASFLGLGLSLVGIGYLYQRYVFSPVQAARKTEPPVGT